MTPQRPPSGPAGSRLARTARQLLRAGLAAALAYAAVLGALWFGQERLLFLPQSLASDHRFDQPADVHEVWIDVPGARLNALHLRLPDPTGVVFFLHGNAGSLQNWFVNVDFYRRLNVDLFMLDYRGYGKSSGRIESEAQLHADVRAAWQAIAPAYQGRHRVIYGRSLGTALAARLAADEQPEQTVLVSPYSSLRELAGEIYPWAPSALLRYPLDTGQALARVRGGVLLAHGEQDGLIPADHSRRLLQRSPQARLLLVPGAGHNDIQRFDAYLQALAQVIAPGR
jgi:uncharacterized protein